MATPIVIGVPEALDPPVVALEEADVAGVVGALDDVLLDEPHAANSGMPTATTPTRAPARRQRPFRRRDDRTGVVIFGIRFIHPLLVNYLD